MLLIVGTAIAASCAAGLTARRLSSARAQALEPDLSEDINQLFPMATKWMPEFERYVRVHNESGIYPVSRANRNFARQFHDISKQIVTYSHHPNEINQKRIKKAMGKFWRALDEFYWPDPDSEWTEVRYDQALKLQRGGLSDEFLNITIAMLDATFTAHMRNTITNSSKYEISNFGVEYQNIVDTRLKNWDV